MEKRSGAIKSPDKTLLKLFNHGISNVQSKNILSNFIKVNKSSIAIKVGNRFIQYKKIKSIFDNTENRVSKLARLIKSKEIVRVLESHNSLTGLIIENLNIEKNKKIEEFDCMWSSSLTDSATKGKPDNQAVDYSSRISSLNDMLDVTSKPLIFDADNGGQFEHLSFLIRSLERNGVSAIIIPKTGSAPITADAVKTSAGAIFNIPICKVDHIKDAIYYLQSCDAKIVAATEKTDNTIYDVPLTGSHALIMGSEGRGINPSVLKIVDYKAKLPLLGKIESLNVSVATGAFLYEAIRQRQ